MIEAKFKAAVYGPKKATIDIPTFSVTLEETMAKKSGTQNLIPLEAIESRIFVLRGHRVMLDRDLAGLYGVETRALNQAVKRNADRFPDDFMFKLTLEEAKAVLALRSQFVTLERGDHLKYAPHVFTGSAKRLQLGQISATA